MLLVLLLTILLGIVSSEPTNVGGLHYNAFGMPHFEQLPPPSAYHAGGLQSIYHNDDSLLHQFMENAKGNPPVTVLKHNTNNENNFPFSKGFHMNNKNLRTSFAKFFENSDPKDERSVVQTSHDHPINDENPPHPSLKQRSLPKNPPQFHMEKHVVVTTCKPEIAYRTSYLTTTKKVPVYSTVYEPKYITKSKTRTEVVKETKYLPRYITETKFVDKYYTITEYETKTSTEHKTKHVTKTKIEPSYVTTTKYITKVETRFSPKYITETKITPVSKTRVLTKTEVIYQTKYVDQHEAYKPMHHKVADGVGYATKHEAHPEEESKFPPEFEKFKRHHMFESMKERGIDYNYDYNPDDNHQRLVNHRTHEVPEHLAREDMENRRKVNPGNTFGQHSQGEQHFRKNRNEHPTEGDTPFSYLDHNNVFKDNIKHHDAVEKHISDTFKHQARMEKHNNVFHHPTQAEKKHIAFDHHDRAEKKHIAFERLDRDKKNVNYHHTAEENPAPYKQRSKKKQQQQQQHQYQYHKHHGEEGTGTHGPDFGPVHYENIGPGGDPSHVSETHPPLNELFSDFEMENQSEV